MVNQKPKKIIKPTENNVMKSFTSLEVNLREAAKRHELSDVRDSTGDIRRLTDSYQR